MADREASNRLESLVGDDLRLVLAKRGDRRSYDDLLVVKSTCEQLECLRQLFTRLHPLQVDELCRAMSLEIHDEGDFIFHQGEKGEKFYVVLTGKCSVLLKQRTGGYETLEDGSQVEQFTLKCVLTCYAGQSFGDRALEFDEPRAASVRAESICEFLTITQHAFKKVLKVQDCSSEGERKGMRNKVTRVLSYSREKRVDKELHEIAEYLSMHIPFFQKFDMDQRVELCRMCELVKVWGKTTLFEQGDKGQAFYIILSGSVNVMVNSTDSEGHSGLNLVNTLHAGASFGERALEDDSEAGKRTATIVTADEMTELIIISREEFQSIVSVMLEGDMLDRVRMLRATDIFSPLSFKNLHKIARLLTPKMFRVDSVLFKAGELAKDVYIIHKGECQLSAEMEMENGNSLTVELGRAGPRAVLGEYTLNALSYYDEVYYKESAVATSFCSTFVFCKIDLFNVLSYEIRDEVIARVKAYMPTNSLLLDSTPQHITETDWCIRETWKKFRKDMSERKSKTVPDKSILRHFRDHKKEFNSVGLIAKRMEPPQELEALSRVDMTSFERPPTPCIEAKVSTPRSISGLCPVKDGRLSSTKFSVHNAALCSTKTLSMDQDDDSSIGSRDGSIHKQKLLKPLNVPMQTSIHGPAGVGQRHNQALLGNNTTITFKPFALVQFHRRSSDKLGLKRDIETLMRFCGTFESGSMAKEAAESQVLNCYIKINHLTFSVQWHRFCGYENMPLENRDHFVVFCRSVPVEYVSFTTHKECDLSRMPFPPSCKLSLQNYACIEVCELRKSSDEDPFLDRSQKAEKDCINDILHPLYTREVGVVQEVYAVSHTKLECTRFACLALKDLISVTKDKRLIVAALYNWYSVTEEAMQSLTCSGYDDRISAEKLNNQDDNSEISQKFSEVLSAYGVEEAPQESLGDVDTLSLTNTDAELIRRDIHSRNISHKVDKRIATASLGRRLTKTASSAGDGMHSVKWAEEALNEMKHQENQLVTSEEAFEKRRENIKSLIASRKQIIDLNDDYCHTEKLLFDGQFNSQKDRQPKPSAFEDQELLKSVSSKRLDVLTSLHNAPTLKSVTNNRLKFQRRRSSTASIRSEASSAHLDLVKRSGPDSPGVKLQQKLEALEDCFKKIDSGGNHVPFAVSTKHSNY